MKQQEHTGLTTPAPEGARPDQAASHTPEVPENAIPDSDLAQITGGAFTVVKDNDEVVQLE